jgi:CRP/FNR family cyclic AMP-dependent transcriptional regulator
MTGLDELKQYEIFSVFPDNQLSELAKISKKKAYEKGVHVYEHGDRATQLYVVSKGLVSLRDIKPGDLVGISYEICEPGELFGTASLMKPQEHSLTAICLEGSEVIAIEADKLFELCEKDPRLGYNLMGTIAQLYFDRYTHAKKQLYEMVKAPTIITALPG